MYPELRRGTVTGQLNDRPSNRGCYWCMSHANNHFTSPHPVSLLSPRQFYLTGPKSHFILPKNVWIGIVNQQLSIVSKLHNHHSTDIQSGIIAYWDITSQYSNNEVIFLQVSLRKITSFHPLPFWDAVHTYSVRRDGTLFGPITSAAMEEKWKCCGNSVLDDTCVCFWNKCLHPGA